jgi:hypothetical protein
MTERPHIARCALPGNRPTPFSGSKNVIQSIAQEANVTFESRKSSVVEADSASAADRSYRCYFTNVDDRIESYEQMKCGNDAEATLKAQELLAASHFTSAELWQGKRIVAKWSNTGDARPNRHANGDGS